MNLRHIRLIIKREYIEKLRSPGFIIGTILGIAVFMGLSFLPILFKIFDSGPTRVAVVDPRNLIYPYIPQITDTLSTGLPEAGGQPSAPSLSSSIVFTRVDTTNLNVLSERVKSDKISAF